MTLYHSTNIQTYLSRGVFLFFFPFSFALSYLFLPLMSFVSLTVFFVLILVFFLKPHWVVYLLIFYIPMIGNSLGFLYRQDINMRLIVPMFSILLLIGFVVLGIRKCSKLNNGNKTNNPALIPFVLFTFYAILICLWKSNPTSRITFAILLINILLFFFVFSLICKDTNIYKNAMWIFIASGSISALLTIISIIFHPDIRIQETICSYFDFIFSWVPGLSRYRGYSFELTNFTSRTLNITASLIIGRLLFLSNKKENYLLFFLLFITVFANCLTSSKGGLGGFLVMIFFILFFSTRLNKYLIRNGLCCLPIVFLIFRISSGQNKMAFF